MTENMLMETRNALMAQEIAEAQRHRDYRDDILDRWRAKSLKKIAMDYGWSETEMTEYLYKKGVLIPHELRPLLGRDYVGCGYTHYGEYYGEVDGVRRLLPYTNWTMKGRLFLYELMKADGILPLCERRWNPDQEVKVDATEGRK